MFTLRLVVIILFSLEESQLPSLEGAGVTSVEWTSPSLATKAPCRSDSRRPFQLPFHSLDNQSELWRNQLSAGEGLILLKLPADVDGVLQPASAVVVNLSRNHGV